MDYELARRNMVESQVRTNRVTHAGLVEAMETVPREKFVPEHLAGIAYVDEAIPLGEGRFVMEPMVLALLLQTAEIDKDDVVLMVGCGSGYGAAIVARLAATVVVVDDNAALAQQATDNLVAMEADNVAIMESPMAEGNAKQGPYDVIVFNGAVGEIPDAIISQLADGGRLVAIVAKGDGLGKGTLVQKFGSSVVSREAFDAGTPVLPGFEKKAEFVL
ncbi:MAG: protein-L-isoaspartate O-methyltransferase [Rhodospirillaceae bacterium]|jgi:protein-L-isoaspartate(D-aspartate) O-methyltransferase